MLRILHRILLVTIWLGTCNLFVSAQENPYFVQKYKEQLANDKLGHVLKATTYKKVVEISDLISKGAQKADIELNSSDILLIRADGFPSSGYTWEIKNMDKNVLQLIANEGEPALGIGAKAAKRFVLKGIDKGETDITFVYRRPWEKNKAPLKEFTLHVNSKGLYSGSFNYVKETPKPIKLSPEQYTSKALPSSYDLRNYNGVTSVKDQQNTNGCWAFGACGSFESVIKMATGNTRDLSEQWLGDCNNYGFSLSGGGWFPQQMFLDYGAVYESDKPFLNGDGSCYSSYPYHEKISGWGYTDGVSDTPWPNYTHNASITQIKQAIYDHGALAANVYVGDAWYSYTGGIIYSDNGSGGHMITLVGWNDSQQYWIIKNSWGSSWGESGYVYISYGSTTTAVGEYSVYVDYAGGTTTDTQAPSTPTNLTATGTTSSSVSLAWTASTDNVGVTGYDVYRNNSKVGTATTNSYTVSGLSQNTTYSFYVKAKDAAGNTSYASNTINATTGTTVDDGGQLTDGVAATGNMSSSDGSDMWFIDVGANATSMHVVLTCGSADFDTYGKFNSQPTTSSYDWRGYTSGGEDNTVSNPQQGRHYIMVDYYSGSGDYTLTATVTYGSTTDTQAPSTPANLTATGTTSSSVSLAWTASTDNVGVTGYDVYRNNSKVGTATTNSYTVSGLSQNTTYSFYVRAKDAAGNTSSASNTINATTGTTVDDGGQLTDGVAATGNMSSSDGSDMWFIDVGANATSMHVVLTCGSADFDTYGKFNSQPTTSSYDWRGYTSGGEDNTVSNPQQGRHYIMVDYYSGSSDYTLTATVTYGSNPNPSSYCDATHSSPISYFYISNVTFGSINKSSTLGSSSNAYSDYTSTSTSVTRGSSHTLSVNWTPNWSANRCSVFIDWNQDGDFEDANETVMSVTGSPTSTSVTVPSNAATGSTRMRVRLTYGTTAIPCGSLTYGETEDYTVSVAPGAVNPMADNNSFDVNIFPNPASDLFTLDFKGVNEAKVQIFNLNGQIMLENNITNQNKDISVSNLSPGVYYVKVSSQDKYTTKKLIIK